MQRKLAVETVCFAVEAMFDENKSVKSSFASHLMLVNETYALVWKTKTVSNKTVVIVYALKAKLDSVDDSVAYKTMLESVILLSQIWTWLLLISVVLKAESLFL